ncbi:hypothetical protein CEXT_229971 [Caerostris extrusa]|uniref:Uncharacterized protein n=1 Tax=Caerostris extrusa TaxID=172846 RepID=A0AAV4UIW5_CAEEX|nr:hypothetical protein CEXT_229971 [Caerostris extrusa]
MRWPEFWLNLDIFVPPPYSFVGAKSLSHTKEVILPGAVSSTGAFTAPLRQPSQVISGFIGFETRAISVGLVLSLPFSYFLFLFFFPFFVMAQEEEDRKAIGGELESEMVILSSATNG